MNPTRFEDLLFGTVLAVVAAGALVVLAVEFSRGGATRDSEVVSMSGGFALMCAFFSLLLCTGWINILPLPR